MKRGRFQSVQEKRKFLRERKKENRLAKDALGNLRADNNERQSKLNPGITGRIIQAGSPGLPG